VSGYVRLLVHEPVRIAEYLRLSLREFTETYTRITQDRRGLSLEENPDSSCVFLEMDSTCRINEVKPEQCKNFPLEWSYSGWEKMCKGCN